MCHHMDDRAIESVEEPIAEPDENAEIDADESEHPPVMNADD